MLAVIYVFAVSSVAAILYVSVDWFEKRETLPVTSDEKGALSIARRRTR
jgi:hypothetical protein